MQWWMRPVDQSHGVSDAIKPDSRHWFLLTTRTWYDRKGYEIREPSTYNMLHIIKAEMISARRALIQIVTQFWQTCSSLFWMHYKRKESCSLGKSEISGFSSTFSSHTWRSRKGRALAWCQSRSPISCSFTIWKALLEGSTGVTFLQSSIYGLEGVGIELNWGKPDVILI